MLFTAEKHTGKKQTHTQKKVFNNSSEVFCSSISDFDCKNIFLEPKAPLKLEGQNVC